MWKVSRIAPLPVIEKFNWAKPIPSSTFKLWIRIEPTGLSRFEWWNSKHMSTSSCRGLLRLETGNWSKRFNPWTSTEWRQPLFKIIWDHHLDSDGRWQVQPIIPFFHGPLYRKPWRSFYSLKNVFWYVKCTSGSHLDNSTLLIHVNQYPLCCSGILESSSLPNLWIRPWEETIIYVTPT